MFKRFRNRGAAVAATGSLASAGLGLICLACVLPGIGAIVGISALVTAVGGVADDGVLVLVGALGLAMSVALGAYTLIIRRRHAQACAADVERVPPAEADA